jgi:uncharacterized cofD-like protein
MRVLKRYLRGEMEVIRRSRFIKWLYPGMHIKRWLLLLMIGVAMAGLGIAYFLREIYVSFTFPPIFYYLTLQFIPQWGRGTLFVGLALVAVVVAVWQLNRSILSALLPHQVNGHRPLVDVIYSHRFLRRGPKIVAIGGGTGLSVLLRGLKSYTANITAVVTVADDGGSSGRLRQEMGVLPPGDVRNCIVALADAEPLMTQLFQYRFPEGSALAGHSFGNLFIVAMMGVVGSFEEAIRQTSRVLAVRGEILPSTLENVTLCARTDGGTLEGESRIGGGHGRILEVYLSPPDPPACPEAVRAILEADMIVLGPGSLYTSIIPNLLVRGIRQAILASSALKVYVCNVATQPGESDGCGVAEHVKAIEDHVGRPFLDVVVVNSNIAPLRPEWRAEPVCITSPIPRPLRVVQEDVVDERDRRRHDPQKLARVLMALYYEREQRAQPLSLNEVSR